MMRLFRSMYMAIFVGALFLGIGCSAKEPLPLSVPVAAYYQGQLPVDIKAIVSDWDEVVSYPVWTYLGVLWAARSKWVLATKLLAFSDLWSDVQKAKKFKLTDKDGNITQIYGAGNYVQYFADKYDPSIIDIRKRLVEAVAQVKPIFSTIALYQQLGLPVVVWTNNDRESYEAKLINLNQQLKPEFKGIPFKLIAGFVIEQDPMRLDDASSDKGKPEAAYYLKAYNYTKKLLNLGDNDVMVFVDDMAENVDAARKVAQEYKLPLIAVQYTTAEQLEHDFALLTSRLRLSGLSSSLINGGYNEHIQESINDSSFGRFGAKFYANNASKSRAFII